MDGRIVVCGGRSHPLFVDEVCKYLSITPTPIAFVDFSNGNVKVTIEGDVRHADVFVIQSGARGGIDNRFFNELTASEQLQAFEALRDCLSQFRGSSRKYTRALLNSLQTHFTDLSSFTCNRDFVELLMIVDALKTSSAGRIAVVMPYMFYVRSDKKEESRISVTAKMVAEQLRYVGADRVLVMDLHAPQIQSFFDIPTDQIFAEPLFFQYIVQNQLEDFIVVTADEGNLKPLSKIASLLGNVPVVIIHKMRKDDSERAKVWSVTGDVDVKGKICFTFDDEMLTGGTLREGIEALMNMGAKAVYVFISHFIASNGAIDMIRKSPLTKLVITNTVSFVSQLPKKVVVCNAAPIFARAIRCIHEEQSASTFIKNLREWSLKGELPFRVF